MRLGREFGWLWAAYATSTVGTRLAFDAFPLVAILVLHSGAAQVSMLSAAGLAVGTLLAVPLGPWVEFRRKRPVMVAMDLLRFLAMLTVPVAYVAGLLSIAQLIVVSVIVAAADNAFTTASGACLKNLVKPAGLLVANGRFESTMWTATAVGPPLGGTLIGMFGPMTTITIDAASYLLSALGIRRIGTHEPPPPTRRAARPSPGDHAARPGLDDHAARPGPGDHTARPSLSDHAARPGVGDIVEGWRYILRHPVLRLLFFNSALVAGLIMVSAPLLAVLLLRDLGFAPWQYGLAFGLPCTGGLIGSRLAPVLVRRYGHHRVMRVSGALRACWSLALAFVGPGPAGLVLIIVTEFGLITCMGVFSPLFATYRLQHTPTDRTARVLSAWSITNRTTVAALTAVWGLLAAATTPRTAIATAGVLLLLTPALLPRAELPQEQAEDDRTPATRP